MPIPITCDVDRRLRYLPTEDLQEFQGDLKELTFQAYNDLRDSILKHGFFCPFFLWVNPDDPNHEEKIIDGHQRLRVIVGEQFEPETEDGWPVVDIAAASREEAAQKLLYIVGSAGTVTDQGLYQFLEENQVSVDVAELAHIRDVNIDDFRANFYEEDDDTGAPEEAEKPQFKISPEMFERQDYLVLAFENEFDWQVACEKLGVETVRDPHQERTFRTTRKGLGRVLSGGKFLEMLKTLEGA